VPLGVSIGFAPYFKGAEVFCAPHSGLAAAQCRVCNVKFVDIGLGSCPYCSSHMIRELT
jgi:hypothetical protein